MSWRAHRAIADADEVTTRTLRRGVVRLYPERARRARRLAVAIAALGGVAAFAAYHAGRLLFLLMTR